MIIIFIPLSNMVDERKPLIKEELRKQKPDLADKTLNNYAACLLLIFKAVIGQCVPFSGFEFAREKRPEIEMFISHSHRFAPASHPIYYSSLILAAQCLGDKSLIEEYRHLNNMAVAEQNKLRRRQGEQMQGTRAVTWPTFRDLVTNKAILDEVLEAVYYRKLKFRSCDFKLLVIFQLIYAFLVYNAEIMAPRLQVFFETELVVSTVWPPREPEDDKNYLFVHSKSANAYLSMSKFKTSKTMGKVKVELSPVFAQKALWNLSNWPRRSFFGDVSEKMPKGTTVQQWLKRAWVANLTGKFLNYMDLRSSLISYFLLTHEKYADKEQYAHNSMTSMYHMELDYRKVGLPAYEAMKADLQESGRPVRPDIARVRFITSNILKNQRL